MATLKAGPTLLTTPWTPEQDNLLIALKRGVRGRPSWQVVETRLRRTPADCRARWNSLKHNLWDQESRVFSQASKVLNSTFKRSFGDDNISILEKLAEGTLLMQKSFESDLRTRSTRREIRTIKEQNARIGFRNPKTVITPRRP